MALIEIWTEILPPDWTWRPTDQFKTGTTEFYIETAKWLTKFGHEVIVYYDEGPAYGEGVSYVPRTTEMEGGEYVLACNGKPPKKGKRTVYWTNLFHDRAENHVGEYDAHIVLSKYHQKLFGLGHVIGHGCYPDRYKNPTKIKGYCLYSSSPDRGLDFLEKIWPEVEKATGAELIATYNRQLPEKEIDDLYKASQFWLHPGQGVELFCISAIKAQAAHCIPIVVPNMALDETVKVGLKVSKDSYKDTLITALQNPEVLQFVWPEVPTWEEQTRKVEKLLLGS